MEDRWSTGARDEFDLTVEEHQVSVLRLANRLVERETLPEQVAGMPLEARMAILLADSKQWLLQNRRRVRIAVVFAMWGEHNRLKPKSETNANGENSLVAKMEARNYWLPV